MQNDSDGFTAYGSAILVVFIWAGWITLSRMGVQTQLTASDITFLRFGTAAILTLPFSIKYNWRIAKWKQVLVVALGCGFPYTMFAFFGLKSIKAANAGVLINGMLPVIGLLIALFWFKEKLPKMKYLAVVILLIANLMMTNLSASFTASNIPGILSLLSAALVFSVYMAAIKRWGYGVKDVVAFVPAINAVLFLPIWFWGPSAIQTSPWQDILIQVIYQGVVVSIFALLLVTYAVNKLGSGTMSVLLSFVPMLTAILAYYFLNESLSLKELFGIALCSIGLVIYARS